MDNRSVDKSTKSQSQPISRRGLLKVGAWTGSTLAAGTVGGIGGYVAGRFINVVEDLAGYGEDPTLGQLFRIFSLGCEPAISVGNVNLAASLQGKTDKPSAFLMTAGNGLTGAMCNAFPNYEPKLCRDYRSVEFENISDAIFLGGPFSNPDTARYLGYDLSKEDSQFPGLPCPHVGPNFQLPFEFLNGETTRGEFDGKVHKAKRYDNGREVERPIYRIKDRDNGRIWACDLDNGWLANEYLQIIRVRDRNQRLKIFAWGLHGHSLSGFFLAGHDNIRENLDALISRTENMEQFHALIPVKLERKRGIDGPYMRSSPDWDTADRHHLIRDLTPRF